MDECAAYEQGFDRGRERFEFCGDEGQTRDEVRAHGRSLARFSTRLMDVAGVFAEGYADGFCSCRSPRPALTDRSRS